MYYGYVPTGTTGAMMNSSNPANKIAGQNAAYEAATSDRGLMNREQNRKGEETRYAGIESANKFGPNGLLAGLVSKVRM